MQRVFNVFRLTTVVVAFAVAGCFPTFQAARIDPGFRIDATATALADQRRHDIDQGNDYLAFVIPAYGFGRRFEVGVPVGLYSESGIFNTGPLNGDKISLLVMPYFKLGLLSSNSAHRLSLTAQTAFVLPANVGLRYSKDLGSWEPQVGVTYVFSGGTVGDDPTITRYQERDQKLTVYSVAATWNRPRRPSIEAGLLRNSYRETLGYDQNGEIFTRTRLYDLFVGLRVSLMK